MQSITKGKPQTIKQLPKQQEGNSMEQTMISREETARAFGLVTNSIEQEFVKENGHEYVQTTYRTKVLGMCVHSKVEIRQPNLREVFGGLFNV
jgi:hypothetical protein